MGRRLHNFLLIFEDTKSYIPLTIFSHILKGNMFAVDVNELTNEKIEHDQVDNSDEINSESKKNYEREFQIEKKFETKLTGDMNIVVGSKKIDANKWNL